jgi:SecD/SecF fusion protein
MTRASLIRAIVALAVIATSAFFAVTKDANLGLDLRGGVQIVLEAQDTPTTVADAAATDRALEVLRRRVDALGVAEPTLARSGENRIIVELPGLDDPAEAAETVGRTAQLTFHPVLGIEAPDPATDPTAETPDPAATGDPAAPDPAATGAPEAPDPAATDAPAGDEASGPADTETPDPAQSQVPRGPQAATIPVAPPADAPTEGGEQPTDQPAEDPVGDPVPTGEEIVIDDEDGVPLRLGPSQLTGEGVSGADPVYDVQTYGGWAVTIDFTGGGRNAWESMTGEAACAPAGDPTRRVAIVLDDEVISSPQVTEQVPCGVGITGGTTVITGQFSADEARELSALVSGGALPVPVEIISQSTVGPTLGDEAIEASWKAGLLGVALTALFITVIYRLLGGLAIVALVSYALISYAALVALGATLTLPGLAGFVLAIGMAVDANVLVFERAREEYDVGKGKGLRSALGLGFNKAWSAIIDSNITTLIAAGLLFFLASGPVRGFGVTLSIGVLASMVSALVITRVLAEIAVNRGWVKKRPGVTGISNLGRVRTWLTARNPDVMKRRRTWLAVSAALVVVSFAGILFRGLDLGVEFTGGRLVEYSHTQPVSIDDARDAVTDAGFPRAVVQEAGEANISVRTGEMTNEEEAEVRAALSEVAGEVTTVRDELVGPTLGDELRRNAFIALGIALLGQLLYLAVRFRWTFGAAAVTAMFHDVVVVVGIFAWLGKPIDGVFLAALLTVIGYSVNDSVVVFDRVRELRALRPKEPFAAGANTAVLQTLPRTINTGLGAIFILAALAVLGGDSLMDFAIALLLGIIVGTWSTVFTATPLAIELDARAPAAAPKPVAQKRTRTPDSSGAVL